jgi:hypothetical protein
MRPSRLPAMIRFEGAMEFGGEPSGRCARRQKNLAISRADNSQPVTGL